MTAIRIVDDHLELANIGSRTHAQIDTAIDSLTDNSIADALHRHSELVASDGSPDPALMVDATGQVGIGTPNPNKTLHVYHASIDIPFRVESGDAKAGFALTDNSGTAEFYSFGGDFRIDTGATGVADLTITGGGRVGIGTTTPATSAFLDLTSTTGALLLTRMTTAQKNALTAVNGMVLYDSTLNKFQGYENGAWTSLI